jgi:hypothetical protein
MAAAGSDISLPRPSPEFIHGPQEHRRDSSTPTLAPSHRQSTYSGRRQSRFMEHEMEEYTPAHSVYEEEGHRGREADGDDDDDDDNEDEYASRPISTTRAILRVMNCLLHGATCGLLLSIMALFLQYGSSRQWYPTMR